MSSALSASTLQFLRELARNNQREWFQENKSPYETARAEVARFTEQLITEISRFDPRIARLDAARSLFRIYRDTRFSADKTPYKTNFGARLGMGKGKNSAGYYLHIEPGKSFLAGGLFQPDAATLKKVRYAVQDHPQEFMDLITAEPFRQHFRGLSVEDKLVRVPTGFDKESSVAEYLKLKSFIVRHPVSDEMLLTTGAASDFAAIYQLIKPLNDFLGSALRRYDGVIG